MSTEDENKAGLVPSQSAALSRPGATSLIRRGRQDLIAKAEAEQWCKQGRALWLEQQYGEAVECFRHGLQLDPNDSELQFLLGAAYHQGNGVPERDYTQAAFWYPRRPSKVFHQRKTVSPLPMSADEVSLRMTIRRRSGIAKLLIKTTPTRNSCWP